MMQTITQCRYIHRVIMASALLIFAILSGCASTKPEDYEKPTLHVTSLTMLPAEGLNQRFNIGLRVLNPNPDPLPLQGIYYTVSLEGFELLSGVNGDLGDVPAYGELTFSVTTSTDMINGVRLLHELMSNPREKLNYQFNAKLDLKNWWIPSVRVEEKGEIELNQH